MTMLQLSSRSLRHRKFTIGLMIVSIAMSTMLLLGVERLRHQARNSFTNTISGVDLVVGPRSGSVSLLLSSVFRIGSPLQNMSWESYEWIAGHPDVAWVVPLSIGDSLGEFKVVGTTEAYFEHYRYHSGRSLELKDGTRFLKVDDVVLGADVARSGGVRVGEQVVLSHGTGEGSFVQHDDAPFIVSGILKPTGTPVDRTVHITLGGMSALHADVGAGGHSGHDHAHHDGHGHEHDPIAQALKRVKAVEQPNISACLVGMKQRAQSLGLQRAINTSTREPLSAVLPGLALQELWGTMALIERVLLVIALMVLAATLVGMLVALLTGLNERRREMAILRSVGARPSHIVQLLMTEAGVVTLSGLLLGVVGLHCLLAVSSSLIQARVGVVIPVGLPTASEWALMGIILGSGIVVGIIPGIKSARQALADGLRPQV